MIKLLHLLQEQNILVPRRSAEERTKNYLIATQKKIQQYIKDGGQGDLNLSATPITSLPGGLKVGGNLSLSGTKITSLPNGLTVGGSLDLDDSKIISLPNGLKVGENLYLNDTPISKKYSAEQIRQMVPGVEGNINM
jgi:hypothetical protein